MLSTNHEVERHSTSAHICLKGRDLIRICRRNPELMPPMHPNYLKDFFLLFPFWTFLIYMRGVLAE